MRMRYPEIVDEIVNDAMLVAWRRARAFDVRARVSTWIVGIALRAGLEAGARMRAHAGTAIVDEAAERLGCPSDTVKTRMFHARRRLRLLLADVANVATA